MFNEALRLLVMPGDPFFAFNHLVYNAPSKRHVAGILML